MICYLVIFLYRHLRIDTIKSYEKAVRQLQHNCNLKYPDEVSKLLILQWRKAVVGKSIIEVTWNSYVRQLKTIFKFGIEKQLLPFTKNPFDGLFIREGKKKRKVYTSSDLKNLALESLNQSIFLLFFAHYGLLKP